MWVRFLHAGPNLNTLPTSSGVPVGLVGVLQASVFKFDSVVKIQQESI